MRTLTKTEIGTIRKHTDSNSYDVPFLHEDGETTYKTETFTLWMHNGKDKSLYVVPGDDNYLLIATPDSTKCYLLDDSDWGGDLSLISLFDHN